MTSPLTGFQKNIYVADALLRAVAPNCAQLSHTENDQLEVEIEAQVNAVYLGLQAMEERLERIVAEIEKDPVLQMLKQCFMDG